MTHRVALIVLDVQVVGPSASECSPGTAWVGRGGHRALQKCTGRSGTAVAQAPGAHRTGCRRRVPVQTNCNGSANRKPRLQPPPPPSVPLPPPPQGMGMHWQGRTPSPPPGRPAQAQPLSPSRQVPASTAFVTDSNRSQPLWRPPATACPTDAGAASEAPSLLPHPCPPNPLSVRGAVSQRGFDDTPPSPQRVPRAGDRRRYVAVGAPGSAVVLHCAPWTVV